MKQQGVCDGESGGKTVDNGPPPLVVTVDLLNRQCQWIRLLPGMDLSAGCIHISLVSDARRRVMQLFTGEDGGGGMDHDTYLVHVCQRRVDPMVMDYRVLYALRTSYILYRIIIGPKGCSGHKESRVEPSTPCCCCSGPRQLSLLTFKLAACLCLCIIRCTLSNTASTAHPVWTMYRIHDRMEWSPLVSHCMRIMETFHDNEQTMDTPHCVQPVSHFGPGTTLFFRGTKTINTNKSMHLLLFATPCWYVLVATSGHGILEESIPLSHTYVFDDLLVGLLSSTARRRLKVVEGRRHEEGFGIWRL